MIVHDHHRWGHICKILELKRNIVSDISKWKVEVSKSVVISES